MGRGMLFPALIASGLLFSAAVLTAAEQKSASVSIIPRPQELTETGGEFVLGQSCVIVADSRFQAEAAYLSASLAGPTGFSLAVKPLEGKAQAKGSIVLAWSADSTLGPEGYTLDIKPERVTVNAYSPAGAFYGIQSFLQLLPAQVFGKTRAEGVAWKAAGVKVRDIPRFGWRAYHLDDARWYHGVDEVKKLLDQMAALKMNEFHWYLTDDQGWRVEIKKYPKLTEVGAWRKDSQVMGWDSPKREGKPHGGFYSQEQIRDMVRYAAERHINIVPVVNMPGHATAAIASYPEMGTVHDQVEVSPIFGKLPSVFNVADEKVYTFLQDILDEVMGLFPSKVIHLGGDEVLFDQWMASPDIKALMEREHLSGPAQVQMYFTNRMSRFVESRGRRMMGWNEIMGDDLHGLLKAAGATEVKEQSDGRSLAVGTIVQFWKGDISLAERAIREGHDIVNSLHSSTYLDYDYETIPLAKAYEFEPIPEGLEKSLWPKVLGSGCQMWSEWTPTAEKIEHQTFPRIAAYAEVGWTNAERKDYPDFCRRMDAMEQRWTLQNINFARVPR